MKKPVIINIIRQLQFSPSKDMTDEVLRNQAIYTPEQKHRRKLSSLY